MPRVTVEYVTPRGDHDIAVTDAGLPREIVVTALSLVPTVGRVSSIDIDDIGSGGR